MIHAIRLSAIGLLLLSGSALAVDPSRFRDVEQGIDPTIIEPILDTGGGDSGGGDSGDDRAECIAICSEQRQTCQSGAAAEYEACVRAVTGTSRAALADDLAYCAEVSGATASSCSADYSECAMGC